MSATHLQVKHDASIVEERTQIISSSLDRKGNILRDLFNLCHWTVDSIESVGGSHFKVQVHNQSVAYKLNIFLSSIRDEDRANDEFKMQIGTSYIPVYEPGWTNIVLGAYVKEENDPVDEMIFVTFDHRRYNFNTNPSLRGARTQYIQKAKVFGFVKTENCCLFRPQFFMYYVQNLSYFCGDITDLPEAEFEPTNDTSSESFDISKYNEYIELLQENHNLILTGAPGTGKTFMAKQTAAAMIAGCKWEDLSEEKAKQIQFVQFHPSYDYTDFVEGLRPDEAGSFKRVDGIFKAFCKRALLQNISKSDSNSIFAAVFSSVVDDIRDGILTTFDGDVDTRPYSINAKGSVVYDKKTQKTDNIRLLFGYIREKGLDPMQMKPDEYFDAISKLTEGKTNTIDYSLIRCMLKELLDRTANISFNEDHDPEPFVFIVDEINRGELSKIFGELFYSIEPNYRGKEGTVVTQYNAMVEDGDIFKNGFYIPENVYIIGTMNDVDRSVESMDFAIRRRFAWREVTAEESAANMNINGLALAKMEALNRALLDNELTEAYCIGGAYFLNAKDGNFNSLWNLRLKGVIAEYFRGDPEAARKIKDVEQKYFAAKENGTEPTVQEDNQPAEVQ